MRDLLRRPQLFSPISARINSDLSAIRAPLRGCSLWPNYLLVHYLKNAASFGARLPRIRQRHIRQARQTRLELC